MNRVAVAVAITLGILGVLYLARLSDVPAHLMHDEVNFALQAHAIATTAHDTNGRLLPVYFSETGFEAGRDPLMIYWTAAALVATPFNEWSVRAPTAVVALASIWLMFLVGRRFFASELLAAVAALCLGLTPGYFTNARLALSVIYPVPFVLMWLYCEARSVESRLGGWALLSGMALGLGVYSYLACNIMMPVLLAVGVLTAVRDGRRRDAIYAVAGFALLMVPLGAWLVVHPERLSSLLTSYQSDVGNLATARGRIGAFWMFFNPEYLFFSGDGRITNSTRAAGLFPLAFLVLIPIGLYQFATSRDRIRLLIAAGFVVAPLATALSGHLDINRILIAVPFGVLLAAGGVERLSAGQRWQRAAALLLLVSVPFQFVSFYRDYVGRYRVTSAAWFGGNNRDAISGVLQRISTSTPSVYLARGTPIERYWRFYCAAQGREDLSDVPTYFSATADLSVAAPGALLVCEPHIPACEQLRPGQWSSLATAAQPDGEVTHRVYERTSQPR